MCIDHNHSGFLFIATVDLELLNCEKLERIREYVKQHSVQAGNKCFIVFLVSPCEI